MMNSNRIDKHLVLRAGIIVAGATLLASAEPPQSAADDRNIAVLARSFHGASIESVRSNKGGFTEPTQ